MKVIGICGISCSGKTTLSRQVQSILGADQCLLISMDDFYKELTPEQKQLMRKDDSVVCFDSPESIDFELLKKTVQALKTSKPNSTVPMPKFDVENCTRSWSNVTPKYKYLIVEGLFILCDAELTKMFDLKIWVETRDYVCALRRFMKFSSLLKGYTHEYIYNQCIRYVIPGQEKFIKPMKSHCDFFINGEIENNGGVDMIVNYIIKRS